MTTTRTRSSSRKATYICSFIGPFFGDFRCASKAAVETPQRKIRSSFYNGRCRDRSGMSEKGRQATFNALFNNLVGTGEPVPLFGRRVLIGSSI
jgi:hypothetical protein